MNVQCLRWMSCLPGESLSTLWSRGYFSYFFRFSLQPISWDKLFTLLSHRKHFWVSGGTFIFSLSTRSSLVIIHRSQRRMYIIHSMYLSFFFFWSVAARDHIPKTRCTKSCSPTRRRCRPDAFGSPESIGKCEGEIFGIGSTQKNNNMTLNKRLAIDWW